jgi:hypothetical protein
VSKHVHEANDLLQMTRDTHRTTISPKFNWVDSPDRPWLDHVHPDASSNEQPSRTSSHNPPCHKRMVCPLLKDVSVNGNADV